jgi:hypothetical protein
LIALGIVAEKNSVWRCLDRDEGDDPLERVDEAEIEHLVGLVQNQDFKLAQRQGALIDEIEQPPRRCNQDIEAARDGAQALRIGNAAEDDTDRKPHELAVGLGAGGDLCRKLARRRKHQHANVAGLGNVARRSKAVERGQHEGCGLAGAGLGDAEQIAAGQNRRDRLALDRRRLRIILRGERIEKGLREPQGHE